MANYTDVNKNLKQNWLPTFWKFRKNCLSSSFFLPLLLPLLNQTTQAHVGWLRKKFFLSFWVFWSDTDVSMSPVKSFQTLSNSTQQQYVRWCSRLVKTRESVSRGHSLIYCRKFGLPHPAMVTVAIRAAGPSPTNVLQWGAADAEIKVPSVENTELSGSPFKAWSRSVYGYMAIHATPFVNW